MCKHTYVVTHFKVSTKSSLTIKNKICAGEQLKASFFGVILYKNFSQWIKYINLQKCGTHINFH